MKKIIIWIFVLFLLIITVMSDPPSEKTIKGEIRQSNHVDQVESGIEVFINNTNTSQTFLTYTYGPPVKPGLYSTTINASENDLIYVQAINDTNWGYVYGIMGKTQLDINVNLNRTRASEAIVKIIIPSNNSQVNSSEKLNVTANITIVGDDGLLCEATIEFSTDVIGLKGAETAQHNLGNINRGTTVVEVWNISSIKDGVSNISVSASCMSDRKIFYNLNRYTVYNITSLDVSAPLISLESPNNNSRVNNPFLLFYSVEEGNDLINCTLSINDLVTNITLYPNKSLILNYSNFVLAGENDLEINCTDNSSRKNMGSSGIFNFTLNNYPFVSNIIVDNPINLLAAANKTVYCNGTITDADSYFDIYNVNASLFFETLNPKSQNNRSTKYSNSSCTLENPSGNNIDFVCGFDMEYYAQNGTWYCNATVIDLINSSNSSQVSTQINGLLAISITPLIDFYLLEPLQISPNDIASNITNYGNVPLDLSIYSYADTDDDNLAMLCTKGSIGYGFEKFSISEYQDFSLMQQVNSKLSPVFVDFNLSQTIYGASENSMKSLFWKLQIPFGTDGSCNGKIVVTAVSSS